MSKLINYKGWTKVCLLENRWIKLHVVPQLGGRIIQLEMDGHEFFFVHPLLAGTEPDGSRLGRNGVWLNFGGEKIWPAPQGWNSPDQWPGPPDPMLDSGEYSLSDGVAGEQSAQLISPVDSYTGLQIEKVVCLAEDSSEVIVGTSFYNKSDVTREWSVWPVIQMNTSGTDLENQYQVICPVSPDSKFPNGYNVMHGLVNNPQYQKISEEKLLVSYQYLVGKVGVDTDSGWIAFVDRKSGKTFVLRFPCLENATYPDGTNVQIWTAGRGIVYSRNVIREHQNNRQLNPPYLELELLSPLQKIHSNKSIRFEYRMQVCTVPENSEISNVSQVGVIASQLKLDVGEGDFAVVGKYGVFRDGILKLRLKNGAESLIELHSEKVSPLKGIDLNLKINDGKRLPDGKAQLSVDFFDQNNCFVESLDTILI